MASSAEEYKFEGWLGHDKQSVEGKMAWGDFEPKAWEETDVDIKITHSGICGTDLHMLRSGWGPTPYPVCVGHEIVGVAVRVGNQVSHIKTGDRVGVGAQGDSCQCRKDLNGEDCSGCDACATSAENYCPRMVQTYGGFHFNGDKSMGGFGRYYRGPAHFAVPIPDGVPSEIAAPMLCGGVTVYSPLVHFGGGGKTGEGALKGKAIGIVGVGGLGHFAVLFAKALGAEKVIGISRRGNKREDALKLGCDDYIATSEDHDWTKKHFRSLDLIISTVSSSQVPLGDYLSLLRRDGILCQVGNPDDGVYNVPAPALILNRVRMTGSCIGSPSELREMLALAEKKNIRPWIVKRPMSEANQAIVDLEAGKARYRYVLEN